MTEPDKTSAVDDARKPAHEQRLIAIRDWKEPWYSTGVYVPADEMAAIAGELITARALISDLEDQLRQDREAMCRVSKIWDRLKSAFDEGEERVAQLQTTGPFWISVEDRLPTEGQENRVLLYLGNLKYPHEPYILWGYYEAGKWWTQWGEFSKDKTPTHWMPLPEAPAALATCPAPEAQKERS